MRDRLTTKDALVFIALSQQDLRHLLDDLGAYDDERREGFPVFARRD